MASASFLVVRDHQEADNFPLCFKQSGAENRCGWPFGCKKTSRSWSSEVATTESMTSLWVIFFWGHSRQSQSHLKQGLQIW